MNGIYIHKGKQVRIIAPCWFNNLMVYVRQINSIGSELIPVNIKLLKNKNITGRIKNDNLYY